MKDYLSWNDILESRPKQKFYSELLDQVYTRSEIIKIVRWDWNRTSDEDEYNLRVFYSKKDMDKTDWMGKPKQLSKKEKKAIIPFDLIKLESKQFRRYDQSESRMRLHNSECELSESPHCSCWCNDLYHGLRYTRLPNEVILDE